MRLAITEQAFILECPTQSLGLVSIFVFLHVSGCFAYVMSVHCTCAVPEGARRGRKIS